MLLVDLNYDFECDWFVELSDNKLSDNNLASELVGNRSFFKPITIEEIVIFTINEDCSERRINDHCCESIFGVGERLEEKKTKLIFLSSYLSRKRSHYNQNNKN